MKQGLSSGNSIPRRIKLGIGCVYFYGPDGDWILDLQLKYITRTLTGYDYTIYAGANRLAPELRHRLQGAPRVQIVELPWYDGQANAEHAFYLDKLLQKAAEDGCTHIAALDSDSFPILPDWPQALLRQMGSTYRLAAVLRSENRDTHLPHPCGYFMSRSFILERQPKLYPDAHELSKPEFRRFLQETHQRVDTGIGYGYELWKSGEPWLKLLRSNTRDLHFLMAGIYGKVFFHLGASSRQPAFHVDYLTRPSLRLALLLRHRPLLWRAAAHLERRYTSKNAQIFHQIIQQLKSDPDEFLSSMQQVPQLGIT